MSDLLRVTVGQELLDTRIDEVWTVESISVLVDVHGKAPTVPEIHIIRKGVRKDIYTIDIRRGYYLPI